MMASAARESSHAPPRQVMCWSGRTIRSPRPYAFAASGASSLSTSSGMPRRAAAALSASPRKAPTQTSVNHRPRLSKIGTPSGRTMLGKRTPGAVVGT